MTVQRVLLFDHVKGKSEWVEYQPAMWERLRAAEAERDHLRAALRAIAETQQSDPLTASWMRDAARDALAEARAANERKEEEGPND